MPIISIIEQPIGASLNAANRPVVFKLFATKTDMTTKPPVVYCDIYFDSVYYKTIAKTQYEALTNGGLNFQYYPFIYVANNGNGTQTVTFNFTNPPAGVATLSIQYTDDYGNSITGVVYTGAYGNSVSGTIPVGNYIYIVDFVFAGGGLVTSVKIPCTKWAFDIQDPCQEIMEKQIGENGESKIKTIRKMWQTVSCKFRSSGTDINGFITTEGIAPIQGTGTIKPVDGSGTLSNTFFVVNAVLQHINNQNLETHLNQFKQGTWDESVFPLTHRPQKKYDIAIGNSDFYPIFSKEKRPSCLTLRYKNRGQNTFHTLNTCNVLVDANFKISNVLGESNNKILGVKINGTFLPDSLFPIDIGETKEITLQLSSATIDIDLIAEADDGETVVVSGPNTETNDSPTTGSVFSFTSFSFVSDVSITFFNN